MTVYGRPRSAFQFDDLPPGFQSPYAAKGWETAKEGVGAILYGGKVVAVMRQLTRATPELLQEIVDTIEKDNPSVPPKSVQGNHVVYYFLDQGNQRIMISALSTKHDGLHITEALGEDTVMNALDMNPAQATVDKAQVDALVDKVKN